MDIHPTVHQCFQNENKKVIGKFKDELNRLMMEEFIGLKAMIYSLKYKGYKITTSSSQRRIGSKEIRYKKKDHTQ